MNAYIYVHDDIMRWRIVNTDEHMDDVMLHTYTYTDRYSEFVLCFSFIIFRARSGLPQIIPLYISARVANLLLFTYMYMYKLICKGVFSLRMPFF